MKVTLLLCVGVLFILQEVESSCSYGPVKTSGREKWCEAPDRSRMNIGDNKRIYLWCVDCSCTDSGLHCCGIGYNAGVITASNKDCYIAHYDDSCCFQPFRRDNPRIPCGIKQCPDPEQWN